MMLRHFYLVKMLNGEHFSDMQTDGLTLTSSIRLESGHNSLKAININLSEFRRITHSIITFNPPF